MRRSIAISTKIYFIGLFEAFVSVLLISSLFFSVALDPARILALSARGFCVVWHVGKALTLGLSPALVVLWTGLSMFIGAFAQLLWQERQITSA